MPGDPNGPPGTGAGNPGNGTPGTAGATSGSGINLTYNGRPINPPKEVEEAGISPSEWAKLPPKVQDALIHANQQGVPPGYRDMVKNYYSRIAKQPE